MDAQKPPRLVSKRILGIDFGLSRLGLALSDQNKIIASPHSVIKAEKAIANTIQNVLNAIAQISKMHCCEIEKIVVGLPLMMSGKTGFLADEVHNFVKNLSEAISIPIETWDERLTTVQAERSLRESSLSRKKRSKIVDMVSASIILQSYLDSREHKLHY